MLGLNLTQTEPPKEMNQCLFYEINIAATDALGTQVDRESAVMILT